MDFPLLQQEYLLTSEQINSYQQNRFIKLKEVFSPEIIQYYHKVIGDKVAEMSRDQKPLVERDTYGKAFLQLFNLWRQSEEIAAFVFNKRLAMIATALMQTSGVRMYHDQALYKEAGGGITPWHADQYYWPLDSDKTITAWIPLQAVPLEMGPLEFSAASHKIKEGRELMIGDESEATMEKRLKVTDFPHVIEAFDIGEISFHSGWVFHRAGANQTRETRSVMTIIYMDQEMRLKQPINDHQINDWHTWCPGAKVGEVIDSPLNPIMYSS